MAFDNGVLGNTIPRAVYTRGWSASSTELSRYERDSGQSEWEEQEMEQESEA